MDAKHFRTHLKTHPFVEFDVKTTDGDTFRVFHPDFAMISPGEDVVIFFDRDNHSRYVDVDHIVSIEPVKPPKKRTGKR
ncbi:MAG: hypothetical protein AAF656_10965 [Planctomycetota bacterium]